MAWIFESSSPMDEFMEKATNEKQSTENWELILHICDAIKSDTKFVKPAITSLKKRLNHRDPHVIMLAISVLDSCWANCGATFRREVSSREFISELESKCKHSVRQISEKSRLMLKKWADNEAKEDDSLSLVRSLYKTLALEGLSFESSEPKKRVVISNDPNVVTSQEEEDAIAQAIAASLSDAPKENGSKSNGSSLYPQAMNGGGSSSLARLDRRVYALYDFEAAEDNELSFKTGDEVVVGDDSNANWWKGRNERTRQEGLFPSSFVTGNRAEVEMQRQDSIQHAPAAATAVVRIDEEQLIKCITLLEDCDPTGAVADPPELAQIEASSLAQAPLIDAALASVDRQSNALAMVDVAIRNVLALYDSAVQQAAYSRYAPQPPPQPMQQQQQYHPQQQQYYQQQPQPAAAAAAPQQQYQQHPQMQPQQQHYAAPPAPQPAAGHPQQQHQQQAPADWQQQQQYLQHMQQQQHYAAGAAAPAAAYQQHQQYAPVPAAAGHPEQQY